MLRWSQVIMNQLMRKRIMRSQLEIINRSFSINRSRLNSYTVLIPEIPPDNVKNNELLRILDQRSMRSVYENDLNIISAMKSLNGCTKLSFDFETMIEEIVNKYSDVALTRDGNSLMIEIERSLHPMETSLKILRFLSCNRSKRSGYLHSYILSANKVANASNDRWMNEPLSSLIEELLESSDNTSPVVKRLLYHYYSTMRLNGTFLTDEDSIRYRHCNLQIFDNERQFSKKLAHSTGLFRKVFSNPLEVADLPEFLKSYMMMVKDYGDTKKIVWQLTLDDHIVQPFLRYSSNRLLREDVFRALRSRASYPQQDIYGNNSDQIEDIRLKRRLQAKILGEQSWIHATMNTRMAGSIESIMTFIDECRLRLLRKVEQELLILQNFAKTEGYLLKRKEKLIDVAHNIDKEKKELLNGIEMWDIQYWRQRYVDTHYSYELSKETMTIERLLGNSLNFISRFFDISFERISNKSISEFLSIHPRESEKKLFVYRLSIANSTETQAILIIDPFYRSNCKSGGTFHLSIQDQSLSTSDYPTSYIGMDLMEDQFNFSQLIQFFDKLGQSLQMMCSKSPFCELSGSRGMEWDAATVSSQLLLTMLKSSDVVGNILNDPSITSNTLTNIINYEWTLRSFDMLQQLYYSAIDMELFLSKTFWYEIEKEQWSKFFPWFSLYEEDYHICQFAPIFVQQASGSYYGHIWSKMLATDIWSSIKEKKLPIISEKISEPNELAVKFRETFLDIGGTQESSKSYRQLLGRDPSIEPFLKSL
ncbi:hypothetical protein SNEBB_010285 [Seison nebaliae]|nr:hypothetical protein SNEBB_010285 [Seison nebaliae]